MKAKNAWLKLLSGNQETTLLDPSQSSFGSVGSVVLPLVSQGKMTYSEHIAWFLEQNDYRLSLPRDIVLKPILNLKLKEKKKSSDTLCLKEPGFIPFWDTIHLGTKSFDDKIKRNKVEHLFILLSCRLRDNIRGSESMRELLTSLCLCFFICKMNRMIVPTSQNCWKD